MDSVGVLVSGARARAPGHMSGLYATMSAMAKKLGMRICLLTPDSFHWGAFRAEAILYDHASGRWRRDSIEIPNVIMDRCFVRSREQWISYRDTVKQCKAHGVMLIGSGMRGKWETYLLLQKDPELGPYMPKTEKYRGKSSLSEWLQRETELFCKPQNGCQGKNTVHIRRTPGSMYQVRGRDGRNRLFQLTLPHAEALQTWFHRFARGRTYIVQPYLHLHTAAGLSYDIRALMQKNEAGKWGLTGMAARVGEPGSATANLHGGGEAYEAIGFLESEFGGDRTKQLLHQMMFLVRRVPPMLEPFGHFFELGIDLGVDRSGNVWLLEVNSKPGRSIFKRLGKRKESLHAVRNPLLYARRLLDRAPSQRGFPRAFLTLGG